MEKTYKVTRQVVLEIEAESRDEAIKTSQQWEGARSICSTAHGYIDWDLRSKLISAKVKR